MVEKLWSSKVKSQFLKSSKTCQKRGIKFKQLIEKKKQFNSFNEFYNLFNYLSAFKSHIHKNERLKLENKGNINNFLTNESNLKICTSKFKLDFSVSY